MRVGVRVLALALGGLVALPVVACGAASDSRVEQAPTEPTDVMPVAAQPPAIASSDGSGPGAPPPSAASSLPAYDPSLSAVMDPRASRVHQRALGLVVTEIQQLETLYKITDVRSRDRPMIVRRLAEDYVELENGLRRSTEGWRGTTVYRAHAAAIANYTLLTEEYAGQPSATFAQNPPAPYPLLDEVYYYLAYEYERAGDVDSARRDFLALLTKAPNSKYVPNAYVAFGDAFFDEALNDPSRWKLARDAYIQAVAAPPPEDKVYGYAWYELGYAFWRSGDIAHAIDAFQRAIDFGAQYAQVPDAAKIGDAARASLARLQQEPAAAGVARAPVDVPAAAPSPPAVPAATY